MLKEQRKIYTKLADMLLKELDIEELKDTLKKWEVYCSKEWKAGNTSYFLTLQLQPLWSKQELSLYVRGYIATGDETLNLIRVRRDVSADFLDTNRKCLKTLSWMIEEFKGEVQAENKKVSGECVIDAKSLWGIVSDRLQELEMSLWRAKHNLKKLSNKPVDKPLVYASAWGLLLEISKGAQAKSEIEELDKILELLNGVAELEALIFYDEED